MKPDKATMFEYWRFEKKMDEVIQSQKEGNQQIMAAIDDAVTALTAVVTRVGASASAEIKAAVAAIAAALAQGGTPQATVDAINAQTKILSGTADTLDAETTSLTPGPTPTPTPTPIKTP